MVKVLKTVEVDFGVDFGDEIWVVKVLTYVEVDWEEGVALMWVVRVWVTVDVEDGAATDSAAPDVTDRVTRRVLVVVEVLIGSLVVASAAGTVT